MSLMPDDKDTTKFEAPPSWALSLIDGQKEMARAVDRLDTNVGALGDNFKTLQDRINRAESRADEFDQWRARTSERVRGESKTNLDQDAVQARILVRVEAVEQKADDAAKTLAAQDETLAAQSATLASQNEKLETIEGTTLEIKKSIVAAIKSPLGQQILRAAGAALLTALGVLTGYLSAKGH